VWQELEHSVHHRDGVIAIAHSDVYLQAEDHQPLGDPTVALNQKLEPVRRMTHLIAMHREWMGSS